MAKRRKLVIKSKSYEERKKLGNEITAGLMIATIVYTVIAMCIFK